MLKYEKCFNYEDEPWYQDVLEAYHEYAQN